MNNSIKKNLDLIRDVESKETLNEGAPAAAALRGAAKAGGKFLPGVGLAWGAYDAYNRAKQGDWTGAALSGLGGLASTIPVAGTAASVGLAGIQAGRDKVRTGSFFPDDDEVAAAVAKDGAPAQTTAAATKPAAQPAATVPPGGDPKVFALQQQLIAKGAKIKADGIMGPQTKAAMQQFPDVAVAETKLKENKMTEAERIAALRARLSQLDQPAEQISEVSLGGAINAVKGIGSAAATAGKNLVRGFKGQPARTATGAFTKPGAATKAGQAASKVGQAASSTAQAIKNNPGKAAVAAGAAGAAAGYMAGKPSATPAATPAPATSGKPPAPAKPGAGAGAATPAKPAAPAAAGPLQQKELDELDAIARELSSSSDPVAVELMGQYNALRSKLGAATPVPGEME